MTVPRMKTTSTASLKGNVDRDSAGGGAGGLQPPLQLMTLMVLKLYLKVINKNFSLLQTEICITMYHAIIKPC